MPTEEKMLINKGPTFLILIEVFHQPEDLLYLLDFVQRTRYKERADIREI